MMRLIDADAVGARMPPLALVEAMRAGHRSGAMGEVERLLVGHGPDAALTWAGWHPDRGFAVKTATVFPGNADAGLKPNIQSVVTLFDARDGAPLAAIHGESFTRMKTAADSALGADLLAAPDAETLAVLGAGGQAETHVRFLLAVRPSLRRILIWNRTLAGAEALAARLAATGLSVQVVAEARAAVEPAAIVTCLTATTAPVLAGDWLAAGAHVDLVGGYTPAMRESDDTVIRRGRLFADSLRFGVETCGDYAQPLAAGVISREAILGDLFDLCTGVLPGRLAASDITVLKNGGGGHLDLMAARAFYDADADAARQGQTLPRTNRWRHRKRGTIYEKIGIGALQTSGGTLRDQDPMMVYRGEADGKIGIRALLEFTDGRFEALSPGEDQAE